MSKLKLNFAGGPYDHFLDIYSRVVEPEGIDLNFHHLHFSEIFYRFTLHREWEVAEMSTAKLVAQIAGERPDIWGLPIFPSRVFRLSNIYIRRDRGITKPEHLRGKKMGRRPPRSIPAASWWTTSAYRCRRSTGIKPASTWLDGRRR